VCRLLLQVHRGIALHRAESGYGACEQVCSVGMPTVTWEHRQAIMRARTRGTLTLLPLLLLLLLLLMLMLVLFVAGSSSSAGFLA
jgi:hypothetical protein